MVRTKYFGVYAVLAAMTLLCVLAGSSTAAAGDTTLVNVGSSGTYANGNSSSGEISDDGRYVAFASEASDLVAGDTNGAEDVFVRYWQPGTPEAAMTRRVSVNSSGNQANNGSRGPSISADGRYVAFHSSASNLVAGDTNSQPDVFVHDRDTGTTERVNVGGSGTQANGGGMFGPSISADGRYVAFESGASNLVVGDTNDTADVFVRDRDTGTTERISLNGCGTQVNDGFSGRPSISADGRYVSFYSNADNLVPTNTNRPFDFFDIFVRDLDAATIQRVNVDSSGTLANGSSFGSSISADGRYVAFDSSASNLSPSDHNGFEDVFVHERDLAQPSDCIGPTTNASAITDTVAYEPGTWTDDDVEVTLSAQDDEGGSGVKELTYFATGAQPIASTTVLANQLPKQLPIINAEGTTTVTYFATDNAGNQETPSKTFTVKIDRSAPKVSATTPAGGATGVARNASPTAAFSERMDPASLTKSTFKLYKCPSTTSTNCTTQVTNVAVAPSTDGLKATLNPYGTSSTLLASRTKYKAIVTTGAKDVANNPLDQNPSAAGNQQKAWYFTTGRT